VRAINCLLAFLVTYTHSQKMQHSRFVQSMITFAAIVVVPVVCLEGTCHGESTCEDSGTLNEVHASAMLQINSKAEPAKAEPAKAEAPQSASLNQKAVVNQQKAKAEAPPSASLNQKAVVNQQKAKADTKGNASSSHQSHTCLPEEMEDGMKEAPSCLPGDVQEFHTSLLATKQEPGACSCTQTLEGKTGADTPIDAKGFLHVTGLCCPVQTEIFFNRMLEANNFKVCSKPHVQGLMHWFTCVPDMDPQALLDVIHNGNPCKYWAPKDKDCPVLSPECQGHWCR